MYLALNESVYLCNGVTGGIVIDCVHGSIYGLDEEAWHLVNDLLTGLPLDSVSDLSRGIIDFLVEKGLAKVTDSFSIQPHIPTQKKNFMQLSTVWFELRSACNLRCIHCYNESCPNADNDKDILNINDWINIAYQLKTYHVKSLILIGGEPLLFDKIDLLIIELRKILPDTSIVLYSNLTLLNNKTIRILKDNNILVSKSIYSYYEKEHDKITKVNGSFKKTVGAVKLLLENGIKVTANTVLMSENEKSKTKTNDFIFSLTGRRGKQDVVRITDESLTNLLPKGNTNTHTISSLKTFSRSIIKCMATNANGHSCWQGKLNISCNGYVAPCIMWHEKTDGFPNVRNQSLNEILESFIYPRYWQLSRDKIKVCNRCEYRYICFDCRPMIQDLSLRGTVCLYNPYTQRWNCDPNILNEYNQSPKIHYQQGQSDVAFVFSCPGKNEELYNHVVAGKTGDNLKALISYLYEILPSVFSFSDMKQYTITNSSDRIHYKNKTGDSEAPLSEILLPENLFRLETELSGMKYIICMGEKAKKAVSAIHIPVVMIKSEHLSNRHLNAVYHNNIFSGVTKPSERCKARIELVGDNIKANIAKL